MRVCVNVRMNTYKDKNYDLVIYFQQQLNKF